MAVPNRPTSPDPAPAEDWADQAADTVVRVVDAVRAQTTGPVLNAARVVVYGIIGAVAAIVALVVLVIALVRLLDVYLPGEVWSAYALLGTVFIVVGWLVWRRRYAPEVA